MSEAVRIKICGITNAEDARTAAGLGADAIGFILAPGKRQLTLDAAASIARSLPPFVSRVAVLVDPPEEEALRVARCGAFTHLQLHGAETPEFCARLPLPVVKAFRVQSLQDASRMDAFMAKLPFVTPLFDGPVGGSGQTCDWELARLAGRQYGVILAGGLAAANVAAAIRAVKPMAVDVSSGVESAPGQKDAALIKAFIDAVRMR